MGGGLGWCHITPLMKSYSWLVTYVCLFYRTILHCIINSINIFTVLCVLSVRKYCAVMMKEEEEDSCTSAAPPQVSAAFSGKQGGRQTLRPTLQFVSNLNTGARKQGEGFYFHLVSLELDLHHRSSLMPRRRTSQRKSLMTSQAGSALRERHRTHGPAASTLTSRLFFQLGWGFL